MAQPQGLNVPVIITTAIVTVLLTGAIFEGVAAYHNYYESLEESRKADDGDNHRTIDMIRADQQKGILYQTTLPVYNPKTGQADAGTAMRRVIDGGGKMPATQPTKS